jgi:hypothetical protein
MLKFTSRTNAIDFVNNHAVKPMRIILGDDELFWVVAPAVASYLESQGYEYAL